MNTIRETFDKSERLCSRKIIETLFENGNIFHNSLLKVVWSKVGEFNPWSCTGSFQCFKKRVQACCHKKPDKKKDERSIQEKQKISL